MSYSYASRRPGGGGGLAKTLLAAKVAFASAAFAAAASFARLAVPQLVSVAGAFFPRAWAAARFWLVPPYLFVTVHLIILVIWKLSGHKHVQAQQHKDPWHHQPSHPPPVAVPAAEEAASPVNPKEEFITAAKYGEPLEPEGSPDSGGGESCVTTESDEDVSCDAYYLADATRSLAPAQEHAVLDLELSPPPPSVAATAMDFGVDDDDLDATWKSIMHKTRPEAAAAPAAPPAPPPPRARDPSVGAEEMNKRFDDFIKKSRHSFRRQ